MHLTLLKLQGAENVRLWTDSKQICELTLFRMLLQNGFMSFLNAAKVSFFVTDYVYLVV